MIKSRNFCLFIAIVLAGCAKTKTAPVKVPKLPDSIKTVTTVLAGGTKGFADGQGTAAAFFRPTGVAFDTDGNLLIADNQNNRIRKMTPGGLVTTLNPANGQPGTDGPLAIATFTYPQSFIPDGSGNFFVLSHDHIGQGSSIRKISKDGNVTTVPVILNGQPVNGNFYAGAVDASGNLFVCDVAHSDIKKITPSGAVTVIGFPAEVAAYSSIAGMAFDSKGNLFLVADNTPAILKLTPGGAITLFCDSYTKVSGGVATQQPFIGPSSIVIDKNDNLFVADWNALRIITKDGAATTVIQNVYAGAVFASYLQQFTMDAQGSIYIPDASNNRIIKIAFP